MESVKSRECPLFKWMRFALPSCYFNLNGRHGDGNLSLIPDMVVDGTGHLLHDIPSDEQFVSGGIVCQHIYEKTWPSDIDIYVPRKYIQGGQYGTYQNNLFHIHPVDGHPLERVIEDFDLSIVQQGFLCNEYFLTPLAFYTQCWHEIVAVPSESNIQYRMPIFVGNESFKMMSRTMWYYIDEHRKSHQENNQSFHECEMCARVQGLPELTAWKERVCKYSARFESFTIVYCKHPFAH